MIRLVEKRLSDEEVYRLSGGQCYDYNEYVEDNLMRFRDRLPAEFHLCNYNTYSRWEASLISLLKRAHIELSYDSMYLYNFGFKVGGNAGGIASDFLRGIINKAWHPISIDELQDVEINKVYRSDKYGCCEPGTRRDIRIIDSVQNIGIGSQASTLVTKTKFYIDDSNNVLVSTSTISYD